VTPQQILCSLPQLLYQLFDFTASELVRLLNLQLFDGARSALRQ
jgi:hypothetical protein